VADAASNGFTAVPDRSTWKTNPDAAFFHYCDNETVHGGPASSSAFSSSSSSSSSSSIWLNTKQLLLFLPSPLLTCGAQPGVEFPLDYFANEANKVDVPVVADMSSNFFSRPVDISSYAVIYGTPFPSRDRARAHHCVLVKVERRRMWASPDSRSASCGMTC